MRGDVCGEPTPGSALTSRPGSAIARELGISKTTALRLYGHVGGARQPGGQPTHRR